MRNVFALVALLAAVSLAPAQSVVVCSGGSCSTAKAAPSFAVPVAVASPMPIPVRPFVVRQSVPSPRAAVFVGPVVSGSRLRPTDGNAGRHRFRLSRCGCGG